MSGPPNARFEDPFLNDAFDFSRYPAWKTRDGKPWMVPHHVRGRVALFAYSGRESPCKAARQRNVSEPQLVSSTNYMRESWVAGFASPRAVEDIHRFSIDDDVLPPVHLCRSVAITCETLADRPRRRDVELEHDPQKTPRTTCKDSCEVTGAVERSSCTIEEDSLYSMDSADQEAHPLLLSMPVIPQIKLERKATVRKPDPGPSPGATPNHLLLSPRIRDLRTPPRFSSRRYGRILARTNPQGIISNAKSHAHGSFWTSLRSGTKLAFMRSVSEPVLNTAYSLDEEQEPLLKNRISGPPCSDVIDEEDSSPESNTDQSKSELSRRRQVHSDSKNSRRRSFMTHSISFSSIIHAVAGGRAPLRSKPKLKSVAATKPELPEPDPNPHDPTSRWAPKQGQIIVKVFVPSTIDIWMFRVPQDINLADFTSTVVNKLGFSVLFSGSVWDEPKYYFRTDERFKAWVRGRIRFGRNLPIVAHIPPPPPLTKLSVDGEGCEVWCYT